MVKEGEKKEVEKEGDKDIEEICKIGFSLVETLLKKKAEGVLAVSKDDKGWKLLVEALERKSIPDTADILGRYEIVLNSKGNLLGYKQVMLRRRASFSQEGQQES